MNSIEKKIRFRKTLYFKMIAVTLLLGITFFIALICIYKVSSNWFKTELTNQSDILTEQICRNVDLSLKELADETIPLTGTNERFGDLLSQEAESGEGQTPFLVQRIRKQMEEMISINYDINWVSIIDQNDEIYLTYRDSRPKEGRPDDQEVRNLYLKNIEKLSKWPGNIVWTRSRNEDGIILMRYIFDESSMKFCGCVIAEVQNKSLKEIFKDIDSSKAGSFTLYDRNGAFLFSTHEVAPMARGREFINQENKEKNKDYLYAEYYIQRSRLKIVHEVNLAEKNKNFSAFLYLISIIGLLLFVIIVIFLWFMFGNMAKNLKILLSNINQVSNGKFDLEPTSFAKGDQMAVLSDHIYEMAGRIKMLMEQVLRAKEIQQQNEYMLLEFKYHELQAQVNPHFLFNTLQSINGIAQINGDEQVSRRIFYLSKFFRGNISRNKASCTLNEEIEYAKNYLELYKNIYPDRLEIQWVVDESLLDTTIPSYILQPIIENSLIHGMEPKIDVCTIRVSAVCEENRLIIKIWDDGQGIPPKILTSLMDGNEGKKRIGLKNVHERIQLMYGADYGVSVDSEYLHYTEVRLEFPLPD